MVAVILITAIITIIKIIVNTTPHELTQFLNRETTDILDRMIIHCSLHSWRFSIPGPLTAICRQQSPSKMSIPCGVGKDHSRFHWGFVASPAVSPQLPPFPLTSFEQNWTRYGFSHSAYPVAPFVTPICTPPSGHLVGSRLWSFFWYLLLPVIIYWSLVPLYHSWTSNYICLLSEIFSTYVFCLLLITKLQIMY